MAVVVSQASLRARVRTAVRQPNANGFISDAEINTLIQEGAYELYDLLVAARGADYYSTRWGSNTAPGGKEIALPADFYRLTSIMITDTPGSGAGVTPPVSQNWVEVQRMKSAEYAIQESYDGSNYLWIKYALAGAQNGGTGVITETIRLFPTPQRAWNIQVIYLPRLDLSNDPVSGEPIYNGVDGWEAYIVAHAAATIAAMQEDDPGFWLAKKAEIKDRIAGLAPSRDMSQPEQVSDRWSDRYYLDYPRRLLPWP